MHNGMPYSIRKRDDAVHRRKEAVVLHEQDVPFAGEVRARRDADRLFFFRDLDQRDVGILFRLLQQQSEPGLGQRRERGDARRP